MARRVIIASDEESDEDSTNKHAKGDVTSDEDSDVKDSDGASRGNIERRTRSGRLRETVTTASKKKPKTTRSIETIKMKGDKRVSLEQPHAHDTLILADQCDACVKREFDTCQVGIDGSGAMMACQVCARLKKRCRYSNGGKGKKPLQEGSVEITIKGSTAAQTEKPRKKEVKSTVKSKLPKPVVEVPPVPSRRKLEVVLDDSASDSTPPRKKARTERNPSDASTSKRPTGSKRSLRRLLRRSKKNMGAPPVGERTATPSPPPPTHRSSSPPAERPLSPTSPEHAFSSPPPAHNPSHSSPTDDAPLPSSPMAPRPSSPSPARTGTSN